MLLCFPKALFPSHAPSNFWFLLRDSFSGAMFAFLPFIMLELLILQIITCLCVYVRLIVLCLWLIVLSWFCFFASLVYILKAVVFSPFPFSFMCNFSVEIRKILLNFFHINIVFFVKGWISVVDAEWVVSFFLCNIMKFVIFFSGVSVTVCSCRYCLLLIHVTVCCCFSLLFDMTHYCYLLLRLMFVVIL